MPGKGAPPLFDLIGDGPKAPKVHPEAPERISEPPAQPAARPPAPPADNGAAAPRSASPAPEPKPLRKASAPEMEEPAAKPDAGGGTLPSGPRIDLKRTLSIPVSVLYVVVPVALVGLLIAFSTGFNLGEKNRDKQLQPYFEDDGGGVVDPLLIEQAGPGAEDNPAQSTPGAETPRQTAPAQRTPATAVTKDTRQRGYNYLLIASRLNGEQAIKAAMYLTERGAAAIAVDPTDGASNNRWQLYSLLGFHSDDFKENWEERADHKTRIQALCSEMTPANGGPIDAGTAYWEKYNP